MGIVNNDLDLFCKGHGCAILEHCQRYVCGPRVDTSASDYSWMSSCDIEERNGFIPTND